MEHTYILKRRVGLYEKGTIFSNSPLSIESPLSDEIKGHLMPLGAFLMELRHDIDELKKINAVCIESIPAWVE